MRIARPTLLLALALASLPASTRADEVDAAYGDFVAGRYGRVFQSLFPYRLEHEGTLRVDFMLGVSACRLADDDFKALGGYLLTAIPKWYRPLKADQLRDIRTQLAACPATGISEQQAIARLSGKTDASGATHLAPARSDSGKDQALPPVSGPAGVTVPPPPSKGVRGMSPLMEGKGFLGGSDYRSVRVESPTECSALCAKENVCLAMTFILSKKMCYLKNALTAAAASTDMVSAVKR